MDIKGVSEYATKFVSKYETKSVACFKICDQKRIRGVSKDATYYVSKDATNFQFSPQLWGRGLNSQTKQAQATL